MNKIKRFSLIIICALVVCTSFIFVGCKEKDEICKLYVFSSVGGHVQVDDHKEVVEFGDEGSKMFTYKQDSVVTLKAVADVGYQFVRWQFNDELEEYDAVKNNAEIKIEIDDDAVIKAEFERDGSIVTHTITYPANPEGYTILAESGYSTNVLDGENFKFKVNLLENYSNSNVVVKANGSILVAVNGVYTISNITNDVILTIEGVAENQPAPVEICEIFTNDTRYVIVPVGNENCKVEEGQNFTFIIELKNGYKFGEGVVVKANGVTLNESTGKYTINSVSSDTEIIVSGIEVDEPATINTYEVYENSELFTIIPVSHNTCEVVEGENFTFTIQLNQGYKLGENVVVKANEILLTPNENKYTIENITSDVVISVEGIEEDVVTPEPDPTPDPEPEPEPQPTIYTISTNETTYTIVPVGSEGCQVEEGQNFTFKIELQDGYKFAENVIVKANETILTESENKYTIENVVSNMVISVEGIEEDVVTPEPTPDPEPEPEPQPTIYTISTNETTYTIVPVGSEGCQVEEGQNFTFKIELQDGYKFDEVVIVSANGITLIPSNNEYTINSVTIDITISVQGIVEDVATEEGVVYAFELVMEDDKAWALADMWDYLPQVVNLSVDETIKQTNQHLASNISFQLEHGEMLMSELIENINNYLSDSTYSEYRVSSFRIGDIEFILVQGENVIFDWEVLSLIGDTETLTIVATK